jgi:hypothetical protein
MADHSVNAPQASPNAISEWVWYEGTDALGEGEGLCYNTDYGTAATKTPARGNRVERPTITNNRAFAGVAARDYKARSTGQLVEIYVPGSKGVNIAILADTVIDTGVLTFVAGSLGSHRGQFYTGSFPGRGSAIPRQTVTFIDESDWVGAVWTVAITGLTITMTSTAGLVAGDTVILVGGEMEEAADKYIIPGKYTISAITSATVVTLTSSCVEGTPADTLLAMGIAYTAGTAKCQADLLTGDESAGVEFLNPPNVGSTGLSYLPGGVSYIVGGITLAADCDVDFADGTYILEAKRFVLKGDLATNDFTIDLVNNGLQLDGTTALTEVLTIDDDTDGWNGYWDGEQWHTLALVTGATEG